MSWTSFHFAISDFVTAARSQNSHRRLSADAPTSSCSFDCNQHNISQSEICFSSCTCKFWATIGRGRTDKRPNQVRWLAVKLSNVTHLIVTHHYGWSHSGCVTVTTHAFVCGFSLALNVWWLAGADWNTLHIYLHVCECVCLCTCAHVWWPPSSLDHLPWQKTSVSPAISQSDSWELDSGTMWKEGRGGGVQGEKDRQGLILKTVERMLEG